MIREHKTRYPRNTRLIKAYICIFICFVTKTVHIKLIVDLTSEALLGILKQLITRKDKIACMYSDNGTNFVGASRELNELYDAFTKEQVQHKLNEFFIESRIEWRNILLNALHFGL